MIKLSELPREPHEAFQTVLVRAQEISLNFPKANLNPKLQVEAVASIRMLQSISRRLSNSEDYREPLERALAAVNHPNPSGTSAALAMVGQLYIANTLDNHFADPEDEHQFNTLSWQGDDRTAVLDSLEESRRFTKNCEAFDAHQKRRILYWIHKAETEVFKEEGRLTSILSAVSQIADTVSEVGEKAKPLADLVKTVRTKTTKNVTEIRQIAGPEGPKKLPAPSDR